jgi:hypothetical protein
MYEGVQYEVVRNLRYAVIHHELYERWFKARVEIDRR